MELSDHQKTDCWICKHDASEFNHCSWCGESFSNRNRLLEHLEHSGDCWRNILKAVTGRS